MFLKIKYSIKIGCKRGMKDRDNIGDGMRAKGREKGQGGGLFDEEIGRTKWIIHPSGCVVHGFDHTVTVKLVDQKPCPRIRSVFKHT